MLKSFDSVRHYFKFKPSKPTIDNLVFKLHYRATFIILLIATILVSSREYIGEHIRCLVDAGVPSRVIETFCFFTTTYTLAKHYNETLLQHEMLPHPGVGPIGPNDETTYHAYYQWVPFFLFGQAIMFYMPHYIWRKQEGGRVARLIDGLQLASLALEDEDITYGDKTVPSKKAMATRVTNIKTDFLMRIYATRPWSTWLVLCEILNLLNVILMIVMTNYFLGGLFISLGPQLIGVNWDGMVDPLDIVFPKVTKCNFYKYGPSGSIQRHDALCVMALNIINEKIFSFLWFWYMILLVITALALVWRLTTFLAHSRSTKFNKLVFYNACPGKLNPWNVLTVTKYCQFADWLFLYYLAKNMDGFTFSTLFVELAKEMDRIGSPTVLSSESGSSMTDDHTMDTLKMEKEPLAKEKDS